MTLRYLIAALEPANPGPDPLLQYMGPALVLFVSSAAIGLFIAIDSNLRGRNAAKWVLAGVFLNVFGLLWWLRVRPTQKVPADVRLNSKEAMRKAREEARRKRAS